MLNNSLFPNRFISFYFFNSLFLADFFMKRYINQGKEVSFKTGN